MSPWARYLQPGRDHRNLDFIGQSIVTDSAEDQVYIFMGSIFDQTRSFFDLTDLEVKTTREVNQDTRCTLMLMSSRSGQKRLLRGDQGTPFARGTTRPHQSHALTHHDGSNICEIDVDHAVLGNQVADALNSVEEPDRQRQKRPSSSCSRH